MDNSNITKKILNKIRESSDKFSKVKPLINEETFEKDNFLRRSEILMEEAEKKILNEDSFENNDKADFVIKASDPQFKNLRNSQEESLRQTVGDVDLKSDALVYHPNIDDITLDGIIKGLNIKFQFRLNDPSGDGCYITVSDLQLTDANTKTIEKIRAGFQNWKQSLISDGNIMKDLENAVKSDNE